MPTFKLSDDEPAPRYMGDSDMYFRQWRMKSMKPVLDEKLDRDFAEAQTRQENIEKEREIRKKKHSEKFDEKLKKLSQQLRSVDLQTNKQPTSSLFLRKSTAEEKRLMREAVDREYAQPSSTALMIPASKQFAPRPMKNPVFGNTMASRANIIKPPVFEEAKGTNTPTLLNNSQESVFFPQEHSSFNLDGYNGARPSFAFFGNAATSTPVSKVFPKFSVGSQISEENSSFDNSKYVTALESPSKNDLEAPSAQKRQEELERIKRLEKEEAEQKRAKEAARLKEKEEKLEALIKREEAARQREQEELERQRIEEERTRAEEAAKQREKEQLELMRNAEEDARQDESEEFERSETQEREERPFSLFKKYADLIGRIEKDKNDYEKNAEPQARSLLKRTITEKVTIFTHKNTSEAEKKDIIEFFRTLLKKLPVDGYSLQETSNPKIELKTDSDVQYSIHCILEKYLSLVELNTPTSMDELTSPAESSFASTIGDLISRISASAKKMETIFIAMIINRSVILRQIPEECIQVFEEDLMKLDVSEQTMVLNRERCLVELFITVFVKNAYFASRKVKLNLNTELLWKYAESVLDWCVEVPKSATVLAYLLVIAKYRLEEQPERWMAFIDYLKNDALPTMLEYQESNEQIHDSSVTYLDEIVKKLKL